MQDIAPAPAFEKAYLTWPFCSVSIQLTRSHLPHTNLPSTEGGREEAERGAPRPERLLIHSSFAIHTMC